MLASLALIVLLNVGLVVVLWVAWLSRRSSPSRHRVPFVIAVLPAIIIVEIIAFSAVGAHW